MIILGIETSCDETAAAILEQKNGRIQILSNVIASSASMQSKYGGIIPEQAAREQIKFIVPVITETINNSKLTISNIDAIAVTYGPGLIGSLLVGVETAKVLSLIWNKPLIPVNHLLGHFYANWIDTRNNDQGGAEESSRNAPQPLIPHERNTESRSDFEIPARQDPELVLPSFPCLGLLVSGGHTDLVIFKNHDKYDYLGGTRDDAAGECFDKSARLIGYLYPGGPKISKIAQKGNPKTFSLPKSMLNSHDLDFSFSGLKTAFANLVAKNFKVSNINPKDADLHWKHIVLEGKKLAKQEQILADMCASIEHAIIEQLVRKTLEAAQKYNIEQIIIAGGVAANKKLGEELRTNFSGEVLIPAPNLCTDNAAMIASRAFFQKPIDNLIRIQANPNLSLSYY